MKTESNELTSPSEKLSQKERNILLMVGAIFLLINTTLAILFPRLLTNPYVDDEGFLPCQKSLKLATEFPSVSQVKPHLQQGLECLDQWNFSRNNLDYLRLQSILDVLQAPNSPSFIPVNVADSLSKSVAKIEAPLAKITKPKALEKANKSVLFWESFFSWFLEMIQIILSAFCVLLGLAALLGLAESDSE